MLSYAQTPAMERRNLEDRLGRLPSKRPVSTARSRTETRSPDRSPADEGDRAARRILNAGADPRGSGAVEVEPEAERAAEFILSAEEPDEDTERAVDLIKNAGRERDAGEDRDEE